jgi:succinate dehydrogenase / fumarate reductase iron-sulfur subunit
MLHRNEHTDAADQEFAFKILRSDRRSSDTPRFARYRVRAPQGMTVLEALLKIQDEQDPTLVFRYSCRGAVCGSCGMVINGRPDLACRVQLATLPAREVLLEPLPNMEVVKDLIVDMAPFWEAYRAVEPWLISEEKQIDREHVVSEKTRAKIDSYVNCILCACCYGACPVLPRDERYLGPAALAKLYRFLGDSRDKRDWRTALERIDSERGLWGCDTVFRCVTACPKHVRPTDGIEGLRRRLVVEKAAGLFRRRRK